MPHFFAKYNHSPRFEFENLIPHFRFWFFIPCF
uniref:Uncharacterized protein n=1 Tax=Siphoviridae sp. ctpoI7 TaxID=2825678 RepID=A0A8S5P910_9CAUD|nr:MAG TPA: hypothetical protein [Siphoviridae sp. ctpoI7]